MASIVTLVTGTAIKMRIIQQVWLNCVATQAWQRHRNAQVVDKRYNRFAGGPAQVVVS